LVCGRGPTPARAASAALRSAPLFSNSQPLGSAFCRIDAATVLIKQPDAAEHRREMVMKRLAAT